MFGVRHRRRLVTVVVATWLASTGATGLPGSDEVVGAQTSAPKPPMLRWPEVEPAPPTVPDGEGALAVPDDWASPVPAVARPPADQRPERVRELVEERSASREVWENADGTRTATFHSDPVFYQPAGGGGGGGGRGGTAAQAAGGWEPIDTALVADPERAGWLRTGANAWIARFGPIEPGAVGGVEIDTPAGRVRLVPDLAEGRAVSGPVAATIAPVPVPGSGDSADSVTYPNAWPGVDLTYRTSGGTLRQQIVLREAGCEAVRFVVEGLDLQETEAAHLAQTLEVSGAQAGLLDLQPLDVGLGVDAAVPAPPGAAGAAMRLPPGAPDLVGDDPNVPGEPQFLATSVAGAWLDRVLHAGEGPVVVGSTTSVGPTALDAYRRLGAPTDTAAAGSWRFGARADDGVRIRLDGDTVVDRWAMGVMPSTATYQDDAVAGESRHTIEVDYFRAFEGAGIELWVRNAEDPADEFVVPAGWLTPLSSSPLPSSPSALTGTAPPPGLPAGWTLHAADASAPYSRAAVSEGTVTLYGRDGGAKAFTKTVGALAGGGSGVPTGLGAAGAAGYRPSAGAADVVTVGPNGSVTVQSPDGTTSVFRPDGGLERVVSAAGDHKPLAAVAAYDQGGRLERLTDPVSGRSTILRYAPSPDCADAPAPLADVSGLAAARPGMLCRVDYWDGTSTTELRDNPRTREGDRSNQAGSPKLAASPDPDGDGPGVPMVRETIYGPAGRVAATRFVGESEWTCTSYDERGRTTAVAYPAASGHAEHTVTHSYAADPDGPGSQPASPLATSVSDPAGTVLTETNLLAEPVRHVDVFGNATVTTYDALGRVAGQQGPVGTLSLSYDAADRLTALDRDGQTIASDVAYDVAGRLVAVAFPGGAGGNGTGGSLGYDTFGRPASASWTGSSGSVVTSDVVARRAGGGVLDQVIDGVDHHPGDDFAYDAAGWPVEAWVPGRHLSFQFAVHDGCGPLAAAGADSNRTHQLIEDGPVTCCCYDRADRLTAADTATGTIGYDGRGNVTAIFGETRRYDGADQVVEVAAEGGPTVSYTRDGLGRVVERKVDGTVVARYGYASATATVPAFTTDAANAVLDAVVTLPGGALLVVRPGAANLWAYPNVAGDLVAGADQTGTKQGDTTIYDPFGNVVAGVPPDTLSDNLDIAWSAQLLDHEPGLQPATPTGYVPILGRTL